MSKKEEIREIKHKLYMINTARNYIGSYPKELVEELQERLKILEGKNDRKL